MRQREGVAVGVGVGVADTRLPMMAPVTGGTATPCMLGSLEQPQASTTKAMATERIASREIRLKEPGVVKMVITPDSHSTGGENKQEEFS